MPLYDYKCDTCGHRFEVRQGIREDALTSCPQCDSPIRRVIYPVGIVFKGSGFYINDSRNSSSTTQPAKDNADSADNKPDKADKKEGAANGSTEAAPVAASGDKAAVATASGGDGAKSANTSPTAATGTSAPSS